MLFLTHLSSNKLNLKCKFLLKFKKKKKFLYKFNKLSSKCKKITLWNSRSEHANNYQLDDLIKTDNLSKYENELIEKLRGNLIKKLSI